MNEEEILQHSVSFKQSQLEFIRKEGIDLNEVCQKAIDKEMNKKH